MHRLYLSEVLQQKEVRGLNSLSLKWLRRRSHISGSSLPPPPPLHHSTIPTCTTPTSSAQAPMSPPRSASSTLGRHCLRWTTCDQRGSPEAGWISSSSSPPLLTVLLRIMLQRFELQTILLVFLNIYICNHTCISNR